MTYTNKELSELVDKLMEAVATLRKIVKIDDESFDLLEKRIAKLEK